MEVSSDEDIQRFTFQQQDSVTVTQKSTQLDHLYENIGNELLNQHQDKINEVTTDLLEQMGNEPHDIHLEDIESMNELHSYAQPQQICQNRQHERKQEEKELHLQQHLQKNQQCSQNKQAIASQLLNLLQNCFHEQNIQNDENNLYKQLSSNPNSRGRQSQKQQQRDLPQRQQIKSLLSEAIALFCQASMNFESELSIEGLLGLTIDNSDVYLISIHDVLQHHENSENSGGCENISSDASTDLQKSTLDDSIQKDVIIEKINTCISSNDLDTCIPSDSIDTCILSDGINNCGQSNNINACIQSDDLNTCIQSSNTCILSDSINICIPDGISTYVQSDDNCIQSDENCIHSDDMCIQSNNTCIEPDTSLPPDSENTEDHIVMTYEDCLSTIEDHVETVVLMDESPSIDPSVNPETSVGHHPSRQVHHDRNLGSVARRKRSKKEIGLGSVSGRSGSDEDSTLELGLSDIPVLVGMGDLSGLDQLDVGDVGGTYFDDVVTEDESHNSFLTGVELDDLISRSEQRAKFSSSELDDIINSESQRSKNDCLSAFTDSNSTVSDKRYVETLGGVSLNSTSVKLERVMLPNNQDYRIAMATASSSRSGDVLLSGATSDSSALIGSPVEWDAGTDDSLGTGEMAPLNLAGPQDLTTESGKLRHTCELCGRQCRSESVLRKHKCKIDKDMPEPLNLIKQPLDLTVGRLDGLDLSTAYVYADLTGDGSLTCVCGRSYTDYTDYAHHATVCSKARMTPYKSCETCGKFFFSNSGYVKHLKLHVGEYKFHCNVCHKGFFDRTHLRAHTDSTHSKVRRYSCPSCDKSFFWKHHLKRHGASCGESPQDTLYVKQPVTAKLEASDDDLLEDDDEVLEEEDNEGERENEGERDIEGVEEKRARLEVPARVGRGNKIKQGGRCQALRVVVLDSPNRFKDQTFKTSSAAATSKAMPTTAVLSAALPATSSPAGFVSSDAVKTSSLTASGIVLSTASATCRLIEPVLASSSASESETPVVEAATSAQTVVSEGTVSIASVASVVTTQSIVSEHCADVSSFDILTHFHNNQLTQLHDNHVTQLHNNQATQLNNNQIIDLQDNHMTQLHENQESQLFDNHLREMHNSWMTQIHDNEMAQLHDNQMTQLHDNHVTTQFQGSNHIQTHENLMAQLHHSPVTQLNVNDYHLAQSHDNEDQMFK